MKKHFFAMLLIMALIFGLTSCDRVKNEVKEPGEIPEISDTQMEPEEGQNVTYELFTIPSAEYPLDFLEVNGRLIILHKDGTVQTLDAIVGGVAGTENYDPYLDEDYAANLIRTNQHEGYDFAVLSLRNILYFDSSLKNSFYIEPLPDIVYQDVSKYQYMREYDFNGESFIWRSDNGIRIMNFDSEESRLLLDNGRIQKEVLNVLERLFDDNTADYGKENFIFYQPRFVCGDTKIAVMVRTADFQVQLLALYDRGSDRFEIAYDIPEDVFPEYSKDGIHVRIWDKVADLSDGSWFTFPVEFSGSHKDNFCYNKEKIFVSEYNDDNFGMSLYLCDIEDMESHQNKIFEINDGKTHPFVVGMTERFVILKSFIYDSSGNTTTQEPMTILFSH